MQEAETERTPAASRDVKNVVALCMLITDNAVSCTKATRLCGHCQGGPVILDSAARCRSVVVLRSHEIKLPAELVWQPVPSTNLGWR